MDRRAFLGALGLLAAPLAAGAQPDGTMHHVGVLGLPAEAPSVAALRQGIQDRGYVEGRNIRFSYRGHVIADPDSLPAMAYELVRLTVDVIVAIAPPAVYAAKAATATVPIVFSADDPVAHGFVSSLARPGGNLTGFTMVGPGFTEKQLQLLKEMVPRARRMAILVGPAEALERYVRESQAAAHLLGVRLHVLEAHTAEDIDRAFAAATAKKNRVDALHVHGMASVVRHQQRIVALAKSARLPAMYVSASWVRAGGLMSFGPDYVDLHRRMATPVDKILKGAKPADLPIEDPIKYVLAINLRTAKTLGLTIPPSLLQRADQVIE